MEEDLKEKVKKLLEVEDELAKRKNEIGQLETKVAELVNLFLSPLSKR